MSHSKRNTSLAFFTSHERSLLKSTWGSQATRLTRDSFLPFASCKLCLLPARDPVACNLTDRADIFCRECALNDLMAQRKEIKRLELEAEVQKGDLEDEELRRRDEAARKDLEDFERVSMGLEAKVGAGTKRKAEEMHGRGDSRRKVGESDDSKTEASFWVPGVEISESNGHKADKKPLKLKPLCPASTPSTKHDFSMKGLTSVKFTEQDGAKGGEKIRLCPSCKKTLSNSSKAMLSKPCGHVICGACYDTFMKPGKRKDEEKTGNTESLSLLCYVCETDLTDTKVKADGKKDKDRVRPGVVYISCEGTGFAGAGGNVAKREGTAFQC